MDVFEKPAVVIDNGTGLVKAGFADEDFPSCILHNFVGRPKVGDLKGDIFFGKISLENCTKPLTIKYPMEHGVVVDWSDMERIWNYIYGKNHLNVSSYEHPLLITEVPLNPITNREKMSEMFFEGFGIPALFVSMQAVLSLYSTGRTTGVVLDSGDGVTSAVPIYKGFVISEGITKVNVAGHDVNKYLRLMLKKEGYNFQTTADLETLRNIKETVCYVTDSPSEEEDTSNFQHAVYNLPDGNSVKVGPSRFRAPEVLFRPDLAGKECEGVHGILYNSVQNSDLDLRKQLYENIILSGGSTLFKGFGKRIFKEMKSICPNNLHIKIAAPKERLYSAWLGGSILAKMDLFKKLSITKKDYEEKGNDCLFNKSQSNMLGQYYI